MISTYTYKKLTWIDVLNPTREEIIRLVETYDIPSLVGDEILVETKESKIDTYEKLLYLVLHFPNLEIGKNQSNTEEEKIQKIDFIIGKNFIITVHHEPIPSLERFSKVFTLDSILEKSELGEHVGFLFFNILRELYTKAILRLEDFDTNIKKIESVLSVKNKSYIAGIISAQTRVLYNFKKSFKSQADTLRSFVYAGKRFWGPDFEYHLSVMVNEYNKIETKMQDQKDMLAALLYTNNSLIQYEISKRIKNLIFSVIIFFILCIISLLVVIQFS